MKKTIMSCSLLFLGVAMYSQQGAEKMKVLHPHAVKGKVSNKQTESRHMITHPSVTQLGFWSDDFSVKTNWTMTSSAGPGLWKIDTIGPIGTYKITKINSTTHANGFATFDSDNDCSGNQIADLTNATAINCSLHPYVNLVFQEQYRRYIDSTYVLVSINGTTWTSYEVNQLVQTNNYCPTNPTQVKLNISAVVGGQSTVWIRFEFWSPSSLGTGSGCSYSWMVDDVYLEDIPANDLSLDKAYLDFGYQGGGYYTQTPVTQIVPMTFRAAISNQGTATQTNNKLMVGIHNASSTVYNQTSGVHSSLAYLAGDTLFDTLTVFTPASIPASYTARLEISQTQVELPADTANNGVTRLFSVTDTVFARDNGMLPISGTIASVDYTGGDVDNSMIANLYQIPVATTVSSISAFIDTSTAPGTTMTYHLLRVDSTGAFNEIATSAIMNIASKTGLGKWITMTTTMPVLPGTYIAAVSATGQVAGSSTSASQGVMIGADQVTDQPLHTSFVFPAGQTPTPAWGYITTLPMIRLNILKGPAGIQEHNLDMSLISAYPNPAMQSISINYQLNKSSDIVITVTDVAGKQVGTIKEHANLGQHTTHLDLGAYASGTYFYTLMTDFGKLNGKFVVNK